MHCGWHSSTGGIYDMWVAMGCKVRMREKRTVSTVLQLQQRHRVLSVHRVWPLLYGLQHTLSRCLLRSYNTTHQHTRSNSLWLLQTHPFSPLIHTPQVLQLSCQALLLSPSVCVWGWVTVWALFPLNTQTSNNFIPMELGFIHFIKHTRVWMWCDVMWYNLVQYKEMLYMQHDSMSCKQFNLNLNRSDRPICFMLQHAIAQCLSAHR